NAPDVHAEVTVELRVFGCDDRLAQDRVDVLVAHDDPALRGELSDDASVAGEDARDGARSVVVERGYLGQVARIGKKDAAQNPQHRREHEQGNQSPALRHADDDVSHVLSVPYETKHARCVRLHYLERRTAPPSDRPCCAPPPGAAAGVLCGAATVPPAGAEGAGLPGAAVSRAAGGAAG